MRGKGAPQVTLHCDGMCQCMRHREESRDQLPRHTGPWPSPGEANRESRPRSRQALSTQ